jgi:DNA-binding transcriptional MerR regulator
VYIGLGTNTGAASVQIGAVAKRTGISVDAIRFYEKTGLLDGPRRTEGGFRIYSAEAIETLEFVRQAQGLGFTLQEIRELVALRSSRLQDCAPVRDRLQQKLLQVRTKIAELAKLERHLAAALNRCNRQLRKQPAPCPVLRRARRGGERERRCE